MHIIHTGGWVVRQSDVHGEFLPSHRVSVDSATHPASLGTTYRIPTFIYIVLSMENFKAKIRRKKKEMMSSYFIGELLRVLPLFFSICGTKRVFKLYTNMDQCFTTHQIWINVNLTPSCQVHLYMTCQSGIESTFMYIMLLATSQFHFRSIFYSCLFGFILNSVAIGGAVASCGSGTCPKAGFFFSQSHVVADHALHGHHFRTLSTAGPRECFRECSVDCRCVSFNTYAGGERSSCQLNEENRHTKPDALKPTQGFNYYDLEIDYNIQVSTRLKLRRTK